jgi:hypothetical protein
MPRLREPSLSSATSNTAGRDGFIPPFMDIVTLCKHICCSKGSIDNWIKQGIFPPPCTVLGSKRLWDWADVEDCLRRKTVGEDLDDVRARIFNATKAEIEATEKDGRERRAVREAAVKERRERWAAKEAHKEAQRAATAAASTQGVALPDKPISDDRRNEQRLDREAGRSEDTMRPQK